MKHSALLRGRKNCHLLCCIVGSLIREAADACYETDGVVLIPLLLDVFLSNVFQM